jgi:precorrin isomerase
MNNGDEICVQRKENKSFRIVTEDYKSIITENEENYLVEKLIVHSTVEISLPKPIWTNSNGGEVLQNGAVLIGGNGLNC